tara:strand:- start:617 stop:910 length:294 start_codon:yes stop_codon:yes gene_type:complete
MEICKAKQLNVGISPDSQTVYFTVEGSVVEAVENESNVVAVEVDKGGLYRPFVRVHHIGSDLMTNLRDYPEFYEKFVNWAVQILAEEGLDISKIRTD